MVLSGGLLRGRLDFREALRTETRRHMVGAGDCVPGKGDDLPKEVPIDEGDGDSPRVTPARRGWAGIQP